MLERRIDKAIKAVRATRSSCTRRKSSKALTEHLKAAAQPEL